MAFTHTKIVCTIGPSVDTVEKMVELIRAGMDVARFNISHGTYEEHIRSMNNLKKARELENKPIAIMFDTKGPEIRIGQIPTNTFAVQVGMQIKLVAKSSQNPQEIPIHPFNALDNVEPGMAVLLADGYIIAQIVEKKKNEVIVLIQSAGVLKSGNKVSIPAGKLNLPAVTSEDVSDIQFACEQDVDLIAASFIRSTKHVLAIKKLLAKAGKSDILVIAKIESSEGVNNFDSIVQVADGIMVARGDLGVEVDLAIVPKLQKMMIRKCFQTCKPVVTATQMLESMMVNPRPTRAEVSDVANAIYDCTSAVMLSGETATGKYPIETVQCMKRIIQEAEADFDYRQFFDQRSATDYHDSSAALARAAVQTAYNANARAIFAFTTGGRTARLVSRLRPDIPILALTSNPKVYQQLSFNWGIIPIYCPNCQNVREAFHACSSFALKNGLISFGDVVVVTAGAPFGKKGTTNMMLLENIGDVIVRGNQGFGEKVTGKVTIVLSPEDIDPKTLRHRLVVIPHCDPSFLPIMKHAAESLAHTLRNRSMQPLSRARTGSIEKRPIRPRFGTDRNENLSAVFI